MMIAVSGGADSVLLLRILVHLHQVSAKGGEMIIAHVDHGTRDSSAFDAEFVGRLAEQHGLQLVSRHINKDALNTKTASEDTLRQAR
ncbi:MAG: ATP-binding protein, partial [Planctomycetota bacterium]|nr:ATP-binding protein [Planctomycetota bacterium]